MARLFKTRLTLIPDKKINRHFHHAYQKINVFKS